jgi:YidC/Oxa1 family membrane protein insertase
MDNPQIIPYYAGHRKTISLMLKLECDMLVTTVPDLQTLHIKRSIAKKDIEYVYVFHAPISTFVQYRETAFDYFDTMFCIGQHHGAELRRREEMTGIKQRKLVKAGYGMYDELLKSYKNLPSVSNSKTRILIAPSWQKDNLFETCIDIILGKLLGKGYEIIVRPHPQFSRLFPEKMDALVNQYNSYSDTKELIFELDFSANDSIFTTDLLITDWSGIAYEYSYCTNKPCLFINTPQKIMNPNYKKYGIEPMEITVRDNVGISIDPESISEKIEPAIEQLLNDNGIFSEQIKETLEQYLYYPGRSGEAGGKYIISKLKG